MVIWAPVGDVSALVSAYFVFYTKTIAAPTPTTDPDEVEIDTPDNLKSNVWRYFGFPKIQGKIKLCKICRTKLAYHATTSNLRAHLSTLHPGKLEEVEGVGSWPRQARIDTMLSTLHLACYTMQGVPCPPRLTEGTAGTADEPEKCEYLLNIQQLHHCIFIAL